MSETQIEQPVSDLTLKLLCYDKLLVSTLETVAWKKLISIPIFKWGRRHELFLIFHVVKGPVSVLCNWRVICRHVNSLRATAINSLGCGSSTPGLILHTRHAWLLFLSTCRPLQRHLRVVLEDTLLRSFLLGMQVRVRSIFCDGILTPKRVLSALYRGLSYIVALADSQSSVIVSAAASRAVFFPKSSWFRRQGRSNRCQVLLVVTTSSLNIEDWLGCLFWREFGRKDTLCSIWGSQRRGQVAFVGRIMRTYLVKMPMPNVIQEAPHHITVTIYQVSLSP